MAEPTYNPATDVHAGELRAMGVDVGDDIPDCGWIPRASVRLKVSAVVPPVNDPDRMNRDIGPVSVDALFDEPFRWIAINGTVEL